ncbi:MAG: hypothetical protein E6Q97_34275 [Desulfurellales bacterium]|nr:MAG: hypothetical protein E6Q97_34275 [Desulfurellales bacterium]
MTDIKWIDASHLFKDGVIIDGVKELIIWDEKNKRSRHGTQIDIIGNRERFTHYIDPKGLGSP